MNQMLREFKEFALRGNVVDMAVGIIIGGAFGKIVSSLVNDVVMPPLGLLVGNVDFSRLAIPLRAATEENEAVTLNYGMFINNVLNFLIIAFVIFMFVRQMNRLKREQEPAPPSTKPCPFCASKIPLAAVRCPQCTSELATA